MNRIFFAIILMFSVFSAQARAAQISTESIENARLTGIKFGDNADIYIKSDTICSVSLQSYMLAGFEIAEVVIDVLGSPSQIRIYAVNDNFVSSKGGVMQKENGAFSAASESVRSALENVENTVKEKNPANINAVIKEYPRTTHSKTLEFKVSFGALKEFHKLFISDFTCKNPKIAGKLYIFAKQ